jgi:hypothetical protein
LLTSFEKDAGLNNKNNDVLTKTISKLEIIYYQANFCDQYNSFGLNTKSELDLIKDFLSQFTQFNQQDDLISLVNEYKNKGEFLKADTLMLLRYKGSDWCILCVDLSIFSLKPAQDIKDLHQIEIIRKITSLNKKIKLNKTSAQNCKEKLRKI